ncbi:MAG: STAS domain-containing protein [Gammaproteobacteria bacterium]|nr:STAS domain-containing protein [Gammaproteobacteria bacterium]
MPGSDAPGVRREADALVFSGSLLRDDVAGAWPPALAALEGAQRLDLTAVPRIDSAGLAMLSALSARAGGQGLAITGSPQGLEELRAAYRLSPSLAFGDDRPNHQV